MTPTGATISPNTDNDSASSVVEARGLGITFPGGVTALDGVDMKLREGEFAAVVGPSGCGKSTLLRLVAGLLPASAGALTVEGMMPAEARKRGTEMSFVFQQPALLPWRTVRANVMLPLELQKRNTPESRAWADELVRLVGLEEFAHAYPRELSGGMRMRVSIARALVTRPRLLLMDEPFGALDEITRQRLNEELLALWQRERCTVLFITHNVFEAVFLAQRVLVMGKRPGRIASVADVPFAHPRARTLRSEPDFARLAGKVSAALEEAAR